MTAYCLVCKGQSWLLSKGLASSYWYYTRTSGQRMTMSVRTQADVCVSVYWAGWATWTVAGLLLSGCLVKHDKRRCHRGFCDPPCFSSVLMSAPQTCTGNHSHIYHMSNILNFLQHPQWSLFVLFKHNVVHCSSFWPHSQSEKRTFEIALNCPSICPSVHVVSIIWIISEVLLPLGCKKVPVKNVVVKSKYKMATTIYM